MIRKILIISSHPIQYNAPLFAYISENSAYEIKVLYTNGLEDGEQYDQEFGIRRSWGIDLLKGYNFEYLKNVGLGYGPSSFFSIINPAILKKAQTFKPDMLIVFGWNYYSHLAIMRFYKGKIPVLFRGDSTVLDDCNSNAVKVYFRYKFLRYIYKHVDYVLSPGTASDLYFNKSGILPSQIFRAAHAVDNSRFLSLNSDELKELENIKQKLYIAPEDFVFLFAGKFIAKKNPLLLVRSFEKMHAERYNIKLILIGNGTLQPEINQLIDSLPAPISQRIVILPFQSQQAIKLYYHLAHVYVLPSRGPGETWGLSVNESLACGTPVIVSDKCGSSVDLVTAGINGYIFKSESMKDLSHKMELCYKSITRKNGFSGVKIPDGFDYHAFLTAINTIISTVES